MEQSRSIWDLERLPFHVGPLSTPIEDRFPQQLPFRVGLRESLGLMTQVFEPHTMDVLREVYDRGSQLGIPMGDQGLGKAYAEDFQASIARWMGDALDGGALLEIGSGSGHLLAALAAAGADASGVEPDPRCREVMAQRGIPVATTTLEDFHTDRTYDCIVHYCVLEHAVDPVAFLLRQRELLSPGGRIVCAVPDCGEAMDDGDISILVHQHWSYFCAPSLRALAAAAGLRVEHESRAEVGALLYASLVADNDDDGREVVDRVEVVDGGEADDAAAARRVAQRFVERGRSAVCRLDEYVNSVRHAGRSLGIYCPTRAFNYVPEGSAAWRDVRLFDDAPGLLGKYVPPFVLPVENGEGLARRPVDEVLIMSRAFGAPIEAAIRSRNPQPTPRIRHIGEVLVHE